MIPGTWEQVSIPALLLFIALCSLGCIWDNRRRRRRRQATASVAHRPRLPTVDYSRAYQRQREWLGDKFLLHTPINRKPS